MLVQGKIFYDIKHDLKPVTIQSCIEDFHKACNTRMNKADKIMGHGWLFFAAEVVVKSVLDLFAGIGMVLGTIIGQGLAKEEHRQKFHDTFFKSHEADSTKAFSQVKQKSLETLAELKKDDNECSNLKNPKL